ncbi:MAG: asparagine synthase (glutamine-hydrolyzing) [Elusimicrobiota bacterium]|jgi:asparagine synthase (glutamine-hydrolysing)
MCGICGIVYNDGNSPDPGKLKTANDLLTHRGPDDSGQSVVGPAGLAMRRLAIIDLSTGHQPMATPDGRYTIVFNGEIYNFQELRAGLQAQGYAFRTRSDTEVILALFQTQGPACVSRLRGMFAFAIWDQQDQRLFVARDRIGKKPLVYTEQPGFLAFASELRSLFVWPGISREADPESIDMYLSLQYIPSPKTVYRQVKKLPPGHVLVYEKGKVSVEKYWDLPLGRPPLTTDFEAAKGIVADKLREAVRLRMISDVPLGAFLSGGVDSSIIVALMSEMSAQPVKTFSIGFEEEEFSELRFAKEVAQRYGCQHTEFVVKAGMADVLPKLAWHYGEPYADPSALPSYYVARETRRFVTVALNGDGGDENFAGYIRYFAMKLARMFDVLPGPARAALKAGAEFLPEYRAPYGFTWRLKRFLRSSLFTDLPARHLKMAAYFSEEDKAGLYTPEFQARLGADQGAAGRYMAGVFAACPNEDFVNRLLYADFKTYLPECLMTKIDIATMATSLEGRSPFLDHEFVETVFRMPGEWKLKGLRGHKFLLKEAFRDKLPSTIFNRGKMGFGIPLGAWFRGPLKNYWEEHVLGTPALSRGVFQESALRRIWAEHQGRRRDHGYRLWALLMFSLWHENCLEGGGQI